MLDPKYRVTGDFGRLCYSEHKTEGAAVRAAQSLSREWGWSHPGAEPAAERLENNGWQRVAAFSYGKPV